MEKKLIKLLENAYANYSNTKVSAIAVTKDGQEFNGVNIENAAYPSGICAERSAMFSAISNGVKAGDIKEIHLTSNTKTFLYPCGACRQVMTELLSEDANIFIYSNGEVIKKSVDEIIPLQVKQKDIN